MTAVTFANPYLLLLLPVCVALTVWLGARAKRHSRFIRIFSVTLRSIGLCLLILAMAGTGLSRRADVTATIFAVDMSDSAKAHVDRALAVLREAEAFRTSKDAAGIVAFGGNAVIESVPSVDTKIGDLQSFVDGKYTSLAAALGMAQSAFPEGMTRRVVLVSDGLENADNALTAARALREAQIAVDVLPMQAEVFDEVQLVGLTVPRQVNKNLTYEIEAEIYSTTANAASISVYKNNTLVAASDVALRAGSNRFVFTDTAEEGGGTVYRAEVRPLRDRFAENNRAYAYGYVAAEPRILLLDYKGSAAELSKMLAASKANVTVLNAVAAPSELDRLNAYDCVVLADVPLDALPAGFDAMLESYVRNTGGGVVAVGGENSYALGGYYNTGLETLLPVEMRLKDMQEVPNLGMVIVLDRSGSMTSGSYGVSKLSLAKEAVIRSVDSLNAQDTFGVLTFDDGFEWAVPLALLGGSASAVQARLAQISAGGGTSILPALQEAANVLANADTKLKHIVLLTDGQAERSGYDTTLNLMANAGITLSTIAVGSDSDLRLLQELAERGGGRYYYTDEFTDLPQIFTKETTLAGKVYLNNRTFYPTVGTVSPLLTGVSALSPLDGYISTTAKPRADVVLRSDTDEPVLAAWQYGLGRAVAWTTDAVGRWTSGWLASGEGADLLRNAVSWTLRRQSHGDISLSLTMAGQNGELVLTTPFEDGVSAAAGVLAGMDGAEYPLTLRASAPGEFRATIDNIEAGAYVAGLTLATEAGEMNASLGVSVSYSAEYDMRRMERGAALLAKIAETTGGQVLKSAEDIYRPIQATAAAGTAVATELLTAALVLLLIDIALRRFPRVLLAWERWLNARLAALSAMWARTAQAAGKALQEKPLAPPAAQAPSEGEATKPIKPIRKKEKPGKPAEPSAAATTNTLLAHKRKREKL